MTRADRRPLLVPGSVGPESLAALMFARIAEMSADMEGVSRPAFSAIETAVLDDLARTAIGLGLAARWDEGRNLWLSLPEDADAPSCVVVGSHVDSVPQGGNFDGLAGIVAGLLCLARARRERSRFARPVKVLALRGEESAWFGACYLGSKALLGRLTEAELGAPHRGDGRRLEEHMLEAGLDLSAIRDGRALPPAGTIDTYVELHIEQGPVLEAADLPLAIVSGIRGNVRFRRITCHGEAGHSGSVPRHLRHDAVLATADLLTALDSLWRTLAADGRDLVLTSGSLSTDPRVHGPTRIADLVTFSLDIRSQEPETLEHVHAALRDLIAEVELRRGVRFELGPPAWTPPASCDAAVAGALAAAAARLGLEPVHLASGAGHDAAQFCAVGIPIGMIFVRNRNGSHNPAEHMDLRDFSLATGVLFEFLNQPGPLPPSTRIDPDMFEAIVDTIHQNGNSAPAYRLAAKAALEKAQAGGEQAVALLLLSLILEEFGERYYDEPLPVDLSNTAVLALLDQARQLDACYEEPDAGVRLAVLSNFALSVSQKRLRRDRIPF